MKTFRDFLWENFPTRTAEIDASGFLDEFEELVLEYLDHLEG